MSIFRSYDVRGIYGKDINEEIMKKIGAAFNQLSTKTIVVAHDMRTSSVALQRAFIEGFGREVIDAGCVPLGVGMYHALGKFDFAYITASHMPKEWNGVKFFHKNGLGFMEQENKKVAQLFEIAQPKGKAIVKKASDKEVLASYIKYVQSKVSPKRKLSVVLDCGNGMASVAAKKLFTEFFDVKMIYDTLDGSFPNRDADPSDDPLTELKKKTLSADMGIAYDGDGDRMVLVDETGRKLTPEQTSYLILLEAVKQPGPIVANVECTRMIDDVAKRFNKKVVRVPVGHTFLMEGVNASKACFGVEVSGHYALPYLLPFDDSLAISIYAATVLANSNRKLSEIINEVHTYPFERINFDCADNKKFTVVENLKKKFKKDYKNVTTMDGVRVDFPKGWILLRASNTSPCIRLTVEGEDKKIQSELKKSFSEILKKEISKK